MSSIFNLMTHQGHQKKLWKESNSWTYGPFENIFDDLNIKLKLQKLWIIIQNDKISQKDLKIVNQESIATETARKSALINS